MWHSLVVRSVRDRKVASSNLVTSTKRRSKGNFAPFFLQKNFAWYLAPSLFAKSHASWTFCDALAIARLRYVCFITNKWNPQNPDFAESEGNGEKAKKQTEFALSKKPTSRAQAGFHEFFFNRIKSKGNFAPFFWILYSPQKCLLRKVEEKAVRQNIIYYVLAKAYFRDGLPLRFSQKVTQAELFASARFARIL